MSTKISAALRPHQRSLFVQWTVVSAKLKSGQIQKISVYGMVSHKWHWYHTLRSWKLRGCVRTSGKIIKANDKDWAEELSSSHDRITALMNSQWLSLPTEEHKIKPVNLLSTSRGSWISTWGDIYLLMSLGERKYIFFMFVVLVAEPGTSGWHHCR